MMIGRINTTSRLENLAHPISPMNLKVPSNSAGTGFDDITATGMSMPGIKLA
jgi:hypothetical protein